MTNCKNMEPVRINVQRGYIPFITKAENIVKTRRKSAVTSRYAPMGDDMPSLLARWPSRTSVTHTKRKRQIVHVFRSLMNVYKSNGTEAARRAVTPDGTEAKRRQPVRISPKPFYSFKARGFPFRSVSLSQPGCHRLRWGPW